MQICIQCITRASEKTYGILRNPVFFSDHASEKPNTTVKTTLPSFFCKFTEGSALVFFAGNTSPLNIPYKVLLRICGLRGEGDGARRANRMMKRAGRSFRGSQNPTSKRNGSLVGRLSFVKVRCSLLFASRQRFWPPHRLKRFPLRGGSLRTSS